MRSLLSGPLCGKALILVLCWLTTALTFGCGSEQKLEDKSALSQDAKLFVRSPALYRGGVALELVPRRYSCRKRSLWLPLRWSRPPQGTGEIVVALSVSELTSTDGAIRSRLVDEWAVGGLIPSRRSLAVGRLPKRAFLVRRELASTAPPCPPRSTKSSILISVYAMPARGFIQQGGILTTRRIEILSEKALAVGSVGVRYGSRDG